MRLARILAALLMMASSPAAAWAGEPLPRSVLILDQSDAHSAWYPAFSSAFRSTLKAASATPVSVYAEHLDLSRFGGAQHDECQAHLSAGQVSRQTDRSAGCPGIIIA